MTDRHGEPYSLDEPEASMGDLIGRLTNDFGNLVQDHVQLAKEEITAEVKKAGAGAGLLGGGAVAGWIAVLLLSLAAAWGLADALDNVWLGFLIVGLLWLAVAAVLALMGRSRLEEVDPKPRQTVHELKEDKEWLTEQTN